METQHTPGPWKALQDGVGYWMVAGSGSPDQGTEARYLWLVESVGPRANVPTFSRGVERVTLPDESAANARLIAAAPDLLEAARDVIFEFEGESAALDKLAAAIAKAEGNA